MKGILTSNPTTCVKGLNIPEPGVPESFKVLIKELQSIALDIRVLNSDSKEIAIKDDDDDDKSFAFIPRND